MPDRREPALPQRFKLVEALLDCECMSSLASRDQVFNQLPREIKEKANRFQSDRLDVVGVLDACLSFGNAARSGDDLITLHCYSPPLTSLNV